MQPIELQRSWVSLQVYIIHFRSCDHYRPLLTGQDQQETCWCNFTVLMMSNTHQLYGWLQECSHALSSNKGLRGITWLKLFGFRCYLSSQAAALKYYSIDFVHSFCFLGAKKKKRRKVSSQICVWFVSFTAFLSEGSISPFTGELKPSANHSPSQRNWTQDGTGGMFIPSCMSGSSSAPCGSVFCQVCLQFQAEALIYLSLQSAGEARLRWVGDPFQSSPTDLHVGGLLQQTDAEGLRCQSVVFRHQMAVWFCSFWTSGWVSRRRALLPAAVGSRSLVHLG